MRISLNWIKDYVSVDAKKIKDLAEKVTNAGVNKRSSRKFIQKMEDRDSCE